MVASEAIDESSLGIGLKSVLSLSAQMDSGNPSTPSNGPHPLAAILAPYLPGGGMDPGFRVQFSHRLEIRTKMAAW